MVNHELKILPEYYKEVLAGKKKFEIRKNDRNFKTEDTVKLREFKDGKYTGNYVKAIIDYIFYGGSFGLEEGYCILLISFYHLANLLSNFLYTSIYISFLSPLNVHS